VKIQLGDEKDSSYTPNSTLWNVGNGDVTKFVTRNRWAVQKKNDFLCREAHIFPSGDAKSGN
jgi:hypothetical protein